ncbi:hypothetical protein TNCT_613251 [Trichonephila clavata]|uniref:Uncharacterized protein n=1 Tax=Trichonephila clavata TaxID=2740835 RepID=A0A8X6LMX2_TRICU|nr:hypothetical protein TNCT_613251 [Trichonephila clavata]
MHSISSKYRKPKGRPSKRRAACIRNLEKGKSACSSSSDSKCDEISTGAVPSTIRYVVYKVLELCLTLKYIFSHIFNDNIKILNFSFTTENLFIAEN